MKIKIFNCEICVCALLTTNSFMRKKQRRNGDNMETINKNTDEKKIEPANGIEQVENADTGAAAVTGESGKTETAGGQEENSRMKSAGKEPESRKDSIRQEYGFASDVKLKECRFCCVMIPKKAKICPNCKMSLKSHWFLKSIAGILTVAVIAAGSYYLSVYWGLLDDSAIPVWMASHRGAAPAMSAASMEPAGTGANLAVVEAVESAGNVPGAEDPQAAEKVSGAEDQQKAEAASGAEDQQTVENISEAEDRQLAEDALGAEDRQTTEGVSGTGDQQAAEGVSGTEDRQAVESVSGIEDRQKTEDAPGVEDQQAVGDASGTEDTLTDEAAIEGEDRQMSGDVSGKEKQQTTGSTLDEDVNGGTQAVTGETVGKADVEDDDIGKKAMKSGQAEETDVAESEEEEKKAESDKSAGEVDADTDTGISDAKDETDTKSEITGTKTKETDAETGSTGMKTKETDAETGSTSAKTKETDTGIEITGTKTKETDAETGSTGTKTKETDADRESTETADRDETAFRADCVQVDYKTLLRKQQEYLDTALMIEAQVVCQVDGGLFDDNTYYLCVTEERNGIKRYYIIRDDREADDTLILEGDTLTIYGRLFGDCKIPAKLIETRPTVPALSMLYYDLTE